MINVSEAFCSDFTQVVMVLPVDGEYIDGIYTETKGEAYPILASVQNPSKQDIQHLTENQRQSKTKTFLTTASLETQDDQTKQSGSLLYYKKEYYEIVNYSDNSDYGFNRYVCVRVQNND